jgi:hypothetical protein
MFFFYSQGEIYTNHITMGSMVNSVFIRMALHMFVKVLKKK